MKWIFAYLFDCVHPHTTWPRRNRAGCAYVACLDCGKELPYSLERMRIVNTEELLADGIREVCRGGVVPRKIGVLVDVVH